MQVTSEHTMVMNVIDAYAQELEDNRPRRGE